MNGSVSLRYTDCDAAIASPDSFLSRLVADATNRSISVVHDDKRKVDLQFTSVQIPLTRKMVGEADRVVARWRTAGGKRRDARWRTANPDPRGNAKAHVWFTGENVRPPAGSWDGYLSFDVDPLSGLNAYVPLWWYSAGVLGPAASTFMSRMPNWEEMLHDREAGPTRPRFACAFVNNPEPMRMHAIRALNKVGQVDVFGLAVGRPVPDKAALAQQYRFVLCFENDVYPGYVTEKPFEAWAMGAVPLWRGLDPAGYLNADAMLNAATATSLDDFTESVARLEGDQDAWRRKASRAIIARPPDLEPAKDLLRRILA